jgi:hypothetical protein
LNNTQTKKETNIMGKQKQARVQLPPMEEVYPVSMPEITEPNADGTQMLIFNIPAPHKRVIFLLSVDTVKEMGQMMAAPHIQPVTPADVAAATNGGTPSPDIALPGLPGSRNGNGHGE